METDKLNRLSVYTEQNIYDFDNRIMLHYYPRRIMELLKESKNLSLLDLGLGHGYSATEFRNSLKEYTILEGDPEIIQQFNRDHQEHGINIIQTFFEDYESEKKFDVIVMGFILEHVEDPLFLLRKYSALLEDNGKLFVAVPNAESLNRRFGNAAGILPDILQLAETDYLLGHKRFFTRGSLKKLCEAVGLTVCREEGLYLKPFTTKQILSLNLDESILNAMCIVGQAYPELSCGILMELQLSES